MATTAHAGAGIAHAAAAAAAAGAGGGGVLVGSRRVGLSSRERVSEMQRLRLFGAVVVVVDELGYARASVAHITSRARVSRRTFYELFENREACFVDLLEHVVATIESEIARAGLEGLSWRERVRGGVWTILCFFDREPALARVCVVQALRGGPRVLAAREGVLARLAIVLDEGRSEGVRGGSAGLTSEGLVGAVFSIVYARLLRGERDPLSGLLGELMGMIVLPYLGPAAARRELARALPSLPAVVPGVHGSGGVVLRAVVEGDPLQGVPMRLTYRTACVLECVAREPGGSNRVLAERAGITDQGQISKLLARLERLGLIANTGEGHARGEANAWTLTPTGQRLAHSISAHTTPNHERAAVSS